MRARRGGGFTLLEVVVSLAILSMIAASLAFAFRQTTRSMERGEAGTLESARLRAGLAILDRCLRQASPALLPMEREAGKEQGPGRYFLGEKEMVRFLSASPAGGAPGGTFRLLSLRTGKLPSGERGMLVAESSPFRADGVLEWSGEEEGARLFLPGAAEATFGYSGGPAPDGDWESTWVEEWDAREEKRLPAVVRVRFFTGEDAGRRSNELYIPVAAGGGPAPEPDGPGSRSRPGRV